MSSWFAAEAEGWNPNAHAASMVMVGNARFTVLTPRLLRLEWAEDGVFEDRASLAFVNRRLPVPSFRTTAGGGWTEIHTDAWCLRYHGAGDGFTPETLQVRVRTGGVDVTWRPGDLPSGNLGGTIRTLDATEGAQALGEGVLSRDGWALVDDSERPLFVGSHRREVSPRPGGNRHDWYLFAHGRDYRGALADFAALSGRIPLPPRWAFGIWWSRYWAYSHTELEALVEDFSRHDVPLDVLVVDMDWHETFDLEWDSGVKDAAGQPKGWTGYTWDPRCFPDPEAFLTWAHGEGLRVPLNLHPASGIQPWEAQHAAMARALGMDPEEGSWIPFRAEDPEFAAAYFEHVIHPLEGQGVDFWWLDWQQWSHTGIPGLTPTMWLGHLFFTDMEARRRSRPVILHRFGGLGSHRYQVGFSGDAASTWPTLAFQPHMTSTASNVLFGYWSHDIGGHEPGPVEPELYTRWVQFGVFSPVVRTHATKHADAERRVWAFDEPYASAMRSALRLRMALLPYIYTAAREAHETGVSLLRPLYYDWPEDEEAYRRPGQYMFGPDLLVHPITSPATGPVGTVLQSTWLPAGRWVAWEGGDVLEGGREVVRSYGLDEIPLFARAGAVVPMTAPAQRTALAAEGPLVLRVFPGAEGAAGLYEDAGDDLGYLEGHFAWTRFSAVPDRDDAQAGVTVTVGPTRGAYPGMPQSRVVCIHIPGAVTPLVREPDDVRAYRAHHHDHSVVDLGERDLGEALVVRLSFDSAGA